MQPPRGPAWARCRTPFIAALGATFAVALLSGCGNSGAPAKGSSDTSSGSPANGQQQRERFTLAVPSLGGDLNPVRGAVGSNELIMHNVAQTLTEGGFDGGNVRPIPMLATSWKSRQDNKIWRFHLRKGVKFSNGETFDATAVTRALKTIQDPKTAATNNAPFLGATIKVIDPYTVDFHLPKPNSSFPLSMSMLPTVAPKAAAADPDAMGKKPIGTGPFVVSESSEDDFTLGINPTYWDKANSHPVAKTIHVVVRPDATARLSALKAGEIDASLDTPPDLAKEAPKVQSVPANENFQLELNGLNGPFTNPKLREAVVIGTDTESIRKAIYTDEFSQSARCQLPPPGTLGYDASMQQPAYDPDRAKQLIKESGYSGEPITVVNNPARYPGGDDVAQAVIDQWKALGLKASLKNLPANPWIAALSNKRPDVTAVPIAFSAFQMNGLDPIITDVSTTGPLQRFPQKEYPQAQDMIAKALAAPDLAAQEKAIQDLSKLVCQSNSSVFIANYDRITAVADDVDFQLERPDLRIFFDEPKPVKEG
jgi:peptide/nickel transport system substrate-binding protein